jgi:hypothetical protein
MNSMDGVNPAQKPTIGPGEGSGLAGAKKLPKSAEEYVAIENRLAAQRTQPADAAQFTSIFDQLRGRMGK